MLKSDLSVHWYEQWKQASYVGKDLQVPKYKNADCPAVANNVLES